MRKLYIIIMGVCVMAFFLSGCNLFKNQIMDGDGMVNSYKQISQEEAKTMMEADDDNIIVDVRRQDEFDSGHIPGAICIPNESIGNEQPSELPDLNQVILVYCRSGRRSKEASQKLFDMGYTNVYEFGGIIDWTGEVVTEDVEIESGYEDMTPMPILSIRVGEKYFTIYTEDNPSAEAFIDKLSSEPITIEMHDYGNYEKVGDLPWDLPRNDEKITTEPGDLILYNGNQITVYYDENTWNFTRLGKLNATEDEIREVFEGEDDIKAEFFVEWTE